MLEPHVFFDTVHARKLNRMAQVSGIMVNRDVQLGWIAECLQRTRNDHGGCAGAKFEDGARFQLLEHEQELAGMVRINTRPAEKDREAKLQLSDRARGLYLKGLLLQHRDDAGKLPIKTSEPSAQSERDEGQRP
jgi:hypothetical protein